MEQFALILVSAVLTNNLVLTQFLDPSALLSAPSRVDAAVVLACATGLVLVLACVAAALVDVWLLTPLGLGFLRTPIFVLVTLGAAQGVHALFAARVAAFGHAPTAFQIAMVTNTALLGVVLGNASAAHGVVMATVNGIGAALGFGLVLVLFTALRARADGGDVPAPWRGAAIGMVTAGLMSLAFMGFAGQG